MKKLFLTLVAALMSATVSFGQDLLVASLNHEDNVTMFYGVSAFQSAHNAAVSGDIITLSGGAFTGFTITKAVTVRGTGIDASFPTRISSNMEINIPESDTERFSVEGVRFEASTYLYGAFSNPYFLKCQFRYLLFRSSSGYDASSITNALFVNCKITDRVEFYGSTTASFSHCFVNGFSSSENHTSKAQFLNCVLFGAFEGYRRSTLVDCILTYYASHTSGSSFPAETVAMYCIAIFYSSYSGAGYKNNMYDKMQGNLISCTASTFEEVFKDYRPNYSTYSKYSDSQTFELIDEAKTRFLGSDGTEIGLYGGENPYNSVPAYPRITKLNVAKQSTADDKLSVDIEVSAAE